MSAATLPKMSPPPRGAPSLNGCSGAPGVTRSPLSMEQGDLPRSVSTNKLQAGVVSLSAPNPKTGAPEPGSYVCTSERGSVQRWHVGPCSGCIGGGVEVCRPPEPWGKARGGDRGERAGGREPRERAQTQPRPPHGLVGVCRDEAGGGGGCRRRGPRSLAWGSVSAHSLRVWGRPAPP